MIKTKKSSLIMMLFSLVVFSFVFVFQGTAVVYAKGTDEVEQLALDRLEELNANKKSLKNLRKAFRWSASLRYKDNTTKKKGKKAAIYYGTYGFTMECGDCNTAAYTFYWMAKMLGYDAKTVQGYVPDGSIKNMRTHAWVMIKFKGKYYYFDPDYNRAMAGKTVTTGSGKRIKLKKNCGFKFTFGTPGTYVYFKTKKKPMEPLKR